MYAANPDYVKSKYNLPMLREIENLVAEAVEVNVPFMNPITYVVTGSVLLQVIHVTIAAVIVLSRTRLVFTPRPS